MDTGSLPQDWKLADVVPIYNKGGKDDPGNYRPVSFMSVLPQTECVGGPTGINTQFHQGLQRNLVIAPKISAHLRRKPAIYISALYMLRYGLVCSITPDLILLTLFTAGSCLMENVACL